MGVRTRSTTGSPVKASSKKVEPQDEQKEPPRVFILPEHSSTDACFLLLQHPRDYSTKRFYFCPERGLYEFTKISAPSIDPRSILFTPANRIEAETISEDGTTQSSLVENDTGYVNKAAELFLATPFDATFLLLPILMPQVAKKSLFQPLDDILESQLDEDKHLKYVFRKRRGLLEEAMNRICDKVEASEETMYRLSEEMLLKHLLGKCQRIVNKGLPSSLEDKFVVRALETPILSIRREETNSTTLTTLTTISGELNDAEFDNTDTQSSTASTAASMVFSEAASIATISTIVEDNTTAKLLHLQRLRTAFNFVTSTYMPGYVSKRLRSLLDSGKSSVDFSPLDSHLAQLVKLRAEAAASRSLGDFSRKRNLEDEDFNETREEKKRKLAEEEKRKRAGESMGVRALKKADVSGMKKMSAFFTKAIPKAKS